MYLITDVLPYFDLALLRPQNASPSSADFFHRLHALSIVAKTPSEWSTEREVIERQRSPVCLGGSKIDEKTTL